jgi:hypothetical protein
MQEIEGQFEIRSAGRPSGMWVVLGAAVLAGPVPGGTPGAGGGGEECAFVTAEASIFRTESFSAGAAGPLAGARALDVGAGTVDATPPYRI